MSQKVTKKIRWLLRRHFGSFLLATQLQNLLLLTIASLRSGSMQIAQLTRHLLLKTAFHHRQKRLLRFIANPRIQVLPLFDQLLTMILTLKPYYRQIPVIIDQTDLPEDYQGLFASIPYQGRALSFAFSIFHYDSIQGSLNRIENAFFAFVASLLKFHGLKPILLLDRGYADVKIIRYLKQLRVHYVIRARKTTHIGLPDYEGALAGLKQVGKWYSVFYQKREKEIINLVTVWGKDRSGKDELIYLVSDIDPSEALNVYRLRMRVEEGFKDIKNAVGLKYLCLKVNVEERLARLVFVAILVAVIAGYLYPVAMKYYSRVAKYSTDLSFVQLVVYVFQLVWYAYNFGFG